MIEIHVTHHEVYLNYELMHVRIEFMIFKGDLLQCDLQYH